MSTLRLSKWLPAIGLIVGILVVWQIVMSIGWLQMESLSTPFGIGQELIRLTASGELLDPLFHTTWIVLVSSLLAIALGAIIGAALGLSNTTFQWSMASVDFLRTLPVVGLLPVAVMLWGPSNLSEIAVTVFASTWVMTVNTAGAFAEVHPRLGDVIQTMRLSRIDALRKVWFPATTAGMLVGARLAITTAVLTAIIAETFVNPQGLGWEIVRSQWGLQPERLWSFAIAAGLFGYLINIALVWAVRTLTPGGRSNPALVGG